MNLQPPKWPLKFLRWFCKDEYLDEIEGDILELYQMRIKQSRKRANAFLFWNVLRSLRWVNLKHGEMNKFGLIRNYFKVGFRALVKDRQFTALNLFGLSMGLSVFLALVLLVQNEMSFDRFHAKADRIYQVIQEFENADGIDPEIWTSWQLSNALRTDLDIVENAVTIHAASSTWTEADGKRFFEEDGIVAGPEFFQIFDFDLKDGNTSEVLKQKRSIILTESLAKKYFEFDNPIGKEVDLEFYGRFTVTGVLEDIPANSYIQFNFILSQDYDVFLDNVSENFRNLFFHWKGDPVATYVLLKDANDKDLFESKVAAMLEKYLDKEAINRHYLLGLLDLHFDSHGIDGRINEYVKGDRTKVKFLMIVGSIILLMACFNYISISTARYIKRSREVGVRKAMGAQSQQVAVQFLIESFLMVLASFGLGMLFTYFLLPYFNMLTGIELRLTIPFLLESLPYFLITIVLVTLFAGFYPAFHLSRYSVVNVIKNMTISTKGKDSLRKSLVIVQYLFVVTILAGLIIVNQQYKYMNSKSLGFNTEQLVVVEINSGQVRNNYSKIKDELLKLKDVQKVTGLTRMISGYRSGTAVEVNTADRPDEKVPMRYYGVDKDGLSTLELQLIAGQDFSGMTGKDSISVIINETAAEIYGGNNAIGQLIKIQEVAGDELNARVIGIVSDFHYRSLRKSIGPCVIGHYNNPFVSLDDIVIQLSGFNTIATLEEIEVIHNIYDTNKVMTWEFMDDMVQREYEKEATFRNVFVGASILSFFIAVLGMIGLSSYNVISRKKEIAIRKILGAGFLSLISQHTREFIKFVLLASLISIPMCWWLAFQWLASFEYRIGISPMIFLLVILFVIVISCLVIVTVSNKTLKSNPVDSIRYE
ncbi:ABC transporter permease [Ekhidna sp. To15]|uniref:ABC transporter permease n=1 Tax=Ekhidna sp. To15 TaxID=3395267 RepID=UPI003F51C8DE